MSRYQTQTPVAFFIFNRPEKTKRVLDAIADVEPSTLFVIADGPRKDVPSDEARCRNVREVVEERVDWNCEVKRNYADENMGLHDRFVSGLEWIFSEEEEAIILEDDCLPNDDFFRFCDDMLDEYRDDERVMDISGSNHLGTWKDDKQDYHFSYYGGIWGWASWRRSWEWYDPEMKLWESQEARDRLRDVIGESQFDYIEWIYQRAYNGDIDTWDYQWGFARQLNSAVSVVPSRNLVSNIGFNAEATHTQAKESELANVKRYELDDTIEGRHYVAADREYDRRFHRMRPISHRNRFIRQVREGYKWLRNRFK